MFCREVKQHSAKSVGGRSVSHTSKKPASVVLARFCKRFWAFLKNGKTYVWKLENALILAVCQDNKSK